LIRTALQDGRDLVVRFVFGFMCFWVISALIMTDIENVCDSSHDNCSFPFHRSLYFIIVTITTVGYGDFVPRTDLGRAFVVGIILLAFACLPVLAGFVIQFALKHQRMSSEVIASYRCTWHY
jgi:uncharacterized membrane protein